ncbi:MAG: SDR family NAD(P)-dependent oxidoreductase [Henriciella sp.]
MKNSKSLIVLGATSALAHAYLRLVAQKDEYNQFFLVGRTKDTLAMVQNDIATLSSKKTVSIVNPLSDPTQISAAIEDIKAATGSIDEVILAYGTLSDQGKMQADADELQSMMQTNLISPVLWMEAIAAEFEQQRTGHLVVIGSVAGDRGRMSNYLYGATKGALERVAEGMAHRFGSNQNITVTLVKPGFMITPMTEGLDRSGPLWAKPEKVAKAISKAVKQKRSRIYVPWFWRFILLIVRALPVPIFHKTKL